MAELPTNSERMEPKLTISGNPIDYELAELLGQKPSDFVVICFDGEQFKSFGTPYDSPRARREQQILVDHLNDKSKESWWPDIFKSWACQIRQQYGLSAETTADDYRPVVSWEIKRVVAGRSEHLHVAIRLFEEIDSKVKTWSVRKLRDGKHLVEIVTADDRPIMESGESLPMVICKAVVRTLKASPSNSELYEPEKGDNKTQG